MLGRREGIATPHAMVCLTLQRSVVSTCTLPASACAARCLELLDERCNTWLFLANREAAHSIGYWSLSEPGTVLSNMRGRVRSGACLPKFVALSSGSTSLVFCNSPTRLATCSRRHCRDVFVTGGVVYDSPDTSLNLSWLAYATRFGSEGFCRGPQREG